MRKIAFIVLSILLLSSSTAFSQLKFGLRGGINDNVRMRSVISDDYTFDYIQGNIGFHFGVTSQIKILGFFAQPEILFSTNSNDVRLTKPDIDNPTRTIEEIGSQRFNKLDVPIMLGVKITKLKLMAGPVFTANVGAKSDLLDKNNIDYLYNTATVGYQIGIGLEGDKLGIELRYEGALSNYGTSMKIGNQSFDTDSRANQFLVSLCFYLGDN